MGRKRGDDRALNFLAESIIGITRGVKSQTRRMGRGKMRLEVGDRVWVRETWRTYERPSDLVDGILYRADGAFIRIANTVDAANAWVDAHANGKHGEHYRTPIYMPRWASRITLRITKASCELLQRMTEEDAIAEGVGVYESQDGIENSAIEMYAMMWDRMHGDGSWKSNPLVHAYAFEVLDVRS